MSSSFWDRQLGAPPAPQQPAPQPQYQQPQQRPWWDTTPPPQPQYQPPQAYGQQQYGALQQQMPGQYGPGQGVAQDLGSIIKQLRKLPSSDLTQEQMEMIADWELENLERHNIRCPRCDSGNFQVAGTRSPIGGGTTGTDKCFDCNYSSRGPEPSLGGRGKAGEATKQTAHGGAVKSNYLSQNGLPAQYIPRM